MKIFCLILCLPFFVFESSQFKNKKIFTEIITVNFKETESYLIKDTTCPDSALRYFDGVFLPLSVNLQNENAYNYLGESVKTIVLKINKNAPNDTFFLPQEFMGDSSKLINYSSGEFMLSCYSDNPVFKRFDLPLDWFSLKHQIRFIKVHLGNYPVTYNYEITSEQKLSRKEIEKIRKKLMPYFETEPDYSDLFDCNKKENERYYNVRPECEFYTSKKCSVRRLTK